MQPQFLHDLVVIRTHGTELCMKIRQFGVIVHQRLVHLCLLYTSYGVDVEDARQIPLKKYIEGCINGEEDHDINQYADCLLYTSNHAHT